MNWVNWAWITAIVFAILGVPFLYAAGVPGADAAFSGVFGWFEFLTQVGPNVRIRWDGFAMVGIALVIFVGIAHYLGRWLYRESGAGTLPEPSSSRRVWRFRWTLALSGLFLLMFVAGISLVGITHQTVWLATSPEPIYESVLPRRGEVEHLDDLKMVGMGFHNFADTNEDCFPGDLYSKQGEPLHSWETRLLPYIVYYAEFDFTRPWNDKANASHCKELVPILLNPNLGRVDLRDSRGFGLSHYAANSRVLGLRDMPVKELAGNTSNTILMGEVNANFKPWGEPGNFRDPAAGINKSPDGFGGAKRSKGVYFVMADGSVRFVANGVSPTVLRAAGD